MICLEQETIEFHLDLTPCKQFFQQYGTVEITKLTLLPYKLAFLYLLNLLAQSLVYMSLDMINESKDTEAHSTKDLPKIVIVLGNLTYTLKVGLLLTFIQARFHSMVVLLRFIEFQQTYRIEELPIVRVHWNKIERHYLALRNGIISVLWIVIALWFCQA